MSVDLYDCLLEIDERLVASGFPRLSPFWKRTWEAFLRQHLKWLVAEVARRGGKGLNAAKLAVVFALHAPLANLPPGERAYVQFLSVDRDEASNRLRVVKAMLDALGVGYDPRGDEVDLKDRPVTIRVSTASIRGTVGRTTILAVCDEVSRWRDSDTHSNPAKEIIASLAPSMLTQPAAKGLILSAPFSENDFFAQRCEQRTNEHQLYVHAPTWVANPTVTEQQTRSMEPDPATWSREYAAIAVAGVTAIASKEELRAVTSPTVTKRPRPVGGRVLVTVDPGFVNDAFAASAWCRELRTGPNGQIVDTIVQLGILHLKPTFFGKVKIKDAIDALDRFCNEYGATELVGDFHYAEAVGPAMQERGKRYTVLPQTSPALTKRVENARARIHEQSIDLLKHAEQTKELDQAQLVAHSGGRLTLRAPERRGCHDDLVSCVLLACDVEGASKLPACESGNIIVRRGRVGFDASIGSLEVEEPKYFERRPDGSMVQRPPPFGSTHFVQWAIASVQRGEWTPPIESWCRERGLTVVQARDNPELLDPHFENRRLSELRDVLPIGTPIDPSPQDYALRDARRRD